jgi:hypothetical protein
LVLERWWDRVASLEGDDGRPDHQLATGIAGEHAKIDQLGGEPTRRGSGKTGAATELTDADGCVSGGDVLKHPESPLDRARGC